MVKYTVDDIQSTIPICQLCHEEKIENTFTLSDNYKQMRSIIEYDKNLLLGEYETNRESAIHYLCSYHNYSIENYMKPDEKFSPCRITCNFYDNKNKICIPKIYNEHLKNKKCKCGSKIKEVDRSCPICCGILQYEIKMLENIMTQMLNTPQYFTCISCFNNYFKESVKAAYWKEYDAQSRLSKIKYEKENPADYSVPDWKQKEDRDYIEKSKARSAEYRQDRLSKSGYYDL